MPNWTREQKNVIDSRKSNLLVAAAAGSGKTAVLIERIVSLILDKKNPIDIDKLLVVTFTKAAASEMRERIGLAIEKALLDDPDNLHLQRQLLLLNKAEICTIDSFCRNILKKNFHVIDVDPNLTTADPTEIELIAKEVMEDLFEELYDEDDEDFLRLVDWYSSRFNDEGLIGLLLQINNFINSSPFPDKWLVESAEVFNTETKEDSYYIENYLLPIAKDALILLEPIAIGLNEINEDLNWYEVLEPYAKENIAIFENLKCLLNSLKTFEEDKAAETWLRVLEDANFLLDNLKGSFRKKKSFDEEAVIVYDEAKKKVDSLKKSIEANSKKLFLSIESIKTENNILYPYMCAISNTVLKFREAFAKKKKGMGVVDFADVEHFALQILMDGDSPSKTALSLRDTYEEVFTDEYQDSNQVQELILSMVSREETPNRFMVGDVKQSIYRFRQAMPEIFMSKYMSYDNYDEVEDSKNKKIMLYKNFRSRAEVLEGCNHVFKSIMRLETGEMDYTEDERLNPGAIFKELEKEDAHVGGPIDVYLADTIEDEESIASKRLSKMIDESDELSRDDIDEIRGFEGECNLIGNIISEMVNKKEDKLHVLDKKSGEYRPVEYKDIVILMRSPSSKIASLEKVLAEYSIPIYCDAGGGYFASIEVSTMINLLKVIDNPIQDIPLLAIMRSPIYNFTSEELAKIRLVDRVLNYYDCVLKYNEIGEDPDLIKKIDDFLGSIEKYRKASTLRSVDEFIWMLLKETGYYTYVGLLFNGEQRQKNLLLLFERARNFEQSSYKGLFNFINYIERMKSKSKDLGEAKNLSEDANLVRVMSIHKSKGLEFPVVIVANSDKGFNLRSDNTSMSLHQTLGYGPKIIDIENMNTFDSSTKKLIDNVAKKEQIAEEMRLLYVAMTRAKEKLIFTGKVKDFAKKEDSWKGVVKDGNANIAASEILSANSYLNWIMMSIIGLDKKEGYLGYGDCKWRIKVDSIPGIVLKKTSLINKPEEKEDKEEIEIKDVSEALDLKFNQEYKYKETAKKPSSISVTEVKKALLKEDEEEVNHFNLFEDVDFEPEIEVEREEMKIPSFMHGGDIKKRFTYAEKGTIFHLVMQVLDILAYKEARSNEEIDEVSRLQIASMVDRNILSEEESETVNIFWIRRFVQSRIFKDLLKAQEEGRIYKEKAINYSIKIADIYKELEGKTDEEMMLVGIVDLFFEKNGKIVLLDYKTDYVDNEDRDASIAKIIEKYRIQLDMYKKAIEDISAKEVESTYLYLFSIGRLIEIK